MRGCRKLLPLVTLVLALVVGGVGQPWRAQTAESLGFGISPNCVFHQGQKPWGSQNGGRHDCSLCLQCVATGAAPAPELFQLGFRWSPAVRLNFGASAAGYFPRTNARGSNQARASPFFA